MKDKTALNQYFALKQDDEEAFNKKISSTVTRQDNDVKSKLHSRDFEAPLRLILLL